MKDSVSKKLDQIISMLADMVTVFRKRFDAIDERFDRMEATQNQHSRDLNQIKHDVADNLDKRKQLQVRVTNIEKSFPMR